MSFTSSLMTAQISLHRSAPLRRCSGGAGCTGTGSFPLIILRRQVFPDWKIRRAKCPRTGEEGESSSLLESELRRDKRRMVGEMRSWDKRRMVGEMQSRPLPGDDGASSSLLESELRNEL